MLLAKSVTALRRHRLCPRRSFAPREDFLRLYLAQANARAGRRYCRSIGAAFTNVIVTHTDEETFGEVKCRHRCRVAPGPPDQNLRDQQNAA